MEPRVGLCRTAQWVDQQLTQARGSDQGSVVRRIVDALSVEELRSLPPEMRRRLTELLKSGRISNAARLAVDKLMSADQVEIEYQHRLLIQGPAGFVEKTTAHLTTLARMPLGRRLLSSLLRSGQQVRIVPACRMCEAPPDDFRAALAKGTILKWRDQFGKMKTIKGIGAGSSTTIKYNPEMKLFRTGEDWRQHPPEIGLAHELIHADDAAYGRLDPEMTDGVRHYECQAVGLPPYEQKEFTENRFRAQWPSRLPARTSY
ncbi:MAG TPA: M91 family zinc metallopeptidase [Blastocatellia bacterium]|nr:M91 family zinc metallopeptidase [Blastocatellia bacterium]